MLALLGLGRQNTQNYLKVRRPVNIAQTQGARGARCDPGPNTMLKVLGVLIKLSARDHRIGLMN